MPPVWRELSRQMMMMMITKTKSLMTSSEPAEICLMIVITQVKELTYMHSEGIQVSVESKIPVKL